MLVAQNSLGPVCPVPLTVRGTLGPMLAFQKHCTRSNTDMLKMRAGPSYICMGFAVLLKATTVVAHLALRAPGNPAEESVARRLAWISMD